KNLLNHSKHINTQASKFTKNNVEALRVNFQPAFEDFVIPNEKSEDFPENYILYLSKINRDMLDKFLKLLTLFVRKLSNIGEIARYCVIFLPECNKKDLIRKEFSDDEWNALENTFSKSYVLTTPDFVVKKRKKYLWLLQNLQNIDSRNGYGEMQIAGEILACGDENIHETGEISDQVLFAVCFISTYVTFYKAEIPENIGMSLA
ncbi:2118_t:CDS:2, partial [Gigaspora margarita]